VHSSPNNIPVIKSRMRWAGHVAHIAEIEMSMEFWWEKSEIKTQIEDLGVVGRVILKLI
jgi:hypothetical protein